MSENSIKRILRKIRQEGGTPYEVGGRVRDYMMGIINQESDIDIEVHNIEAEKVERILNIEGRVSLVGNSFGVFHFKGNDGFSAEISLPRKETKTGRGHTGFYVETDPWLDIVSACKRRDFTINSMVRCPFYGTIFDPYSGSKDIKNKILRHVSSKFSEDPLRVIRGARFASRFDLQWHPETKNLCSSILPEADSLPPERIWNEIKKWANESEHPSLFFVRLEEVGWLHKVCEPLWLLMGLPQDCTHHPEGDAYTHTLICLDHAKIIADRENLEGDEKLTFFLAALCHDFGKFSCTTTETDGKITSKAHDKVGAEITKRWLDSLNAPNIIIDGVSALVKEHMFRRHKNTKPSAFMRLRKRLHPATLKLLVLLTECDYSSRPPMPPGSPLSTILEENIPIQQEPMPEAIITGAHLIKLGMVPGKMLGSVKKRVYEKQIDGEFSSLEEGLKIAMECWNDQKNKRVSPS